MRDRGQLLRGQRGAVRLGALWGRTKNPIRPLLTQVESGRIVRRQPRSAAWSGRSEADSSEVVAEGVAKSAIEPDLTDFIAKRIAKRAASERSDLLPEYARYSARAAYRAKSLAERTPKVARQPILPRPDRPVWVRLQKREDGRTGSRTDVAWTRRLVMRPLNERPDIAVLALVPVGLGAGEVQLRLIAAAIPVVLRPRAEGTRAAVLALPTVIAAVNHFGPPLPRSRFMERSATRRSDHAPDQIELLVSQPE